VTDRAASRGSAAPILLAGFLLLALVVATSMLFAARERGTDKDVQRTLMTEDRLADTLSSVRQAESGVRGYMITGNAISLNTYQLALADLPRQLAALDRAMAGGPDAPRLADIHQLVALKLQQLGAVMELEEAGQPKAAAARVNADLNLATMQSLRALIGQLRDEQAARLAGAEAQATRAGWALEGTISVAVLGILILAWIAFRESRARTAELRDAEAKLTLANEALERKVQARTASLKETEARFRTLAESIPGLVYMTDAAGLTTYVNPQSLDFTGLPFEALMGHGWTRTVHPDDLPWCLARWEESVASGRDYEIEYRLRQHDGVFRWFLDRATPLRDEAGAITAWIGTSTDIDDRKAAEAAMADENARLEQRAAARAAELDRIFRLSTDILTVGGFDGKFTAVSPAWAIITGHSAQAALTQPFWTFLHPDDQAATMEAFGKLQAGEHIAVENRYRRADGTYCWLAWRAVAEPGRGVIYCVARDITAERERAEQLRQSQKMEVVGQLTGGVAHDFNNLLTIILGSLESLIRGATGLDPGILRRAEAAMEAARRAASLTHRLLAFSRRQPLQPQPLDINRLLAGMSDMLHRTLGESYEIEIAGAAGLWRALADANQLENAILNLAVNARDAMPQGGRLVIETRNAWADDAASRPDVPAGPYVEITVTDTGTGMTAQVRDKIFEPFFTTKPQGHGTGLGLAQVYGFVKQSGGHVSVESEPGAGTAVTLLLPRADGGAEGDVAPAAASLPHQVRGESILIVEDEAGVRGFAAEVLSERGYEVVSAADAAQAISVFETAAPIKMLFTDVVLTGGMNGRQLADQLLARRPDLLVLFTSGYTRDALNQEGRLEEGIAFLPKPFTATALTDKIAGLFEAARVTSSLD
jgi:PAS domain S-box-containing protein